MEMLNLTLGPLTSLQTILLHRTLEPRTIDVGGTGRR